jgi:glyoxylase-like metal-dependent hydrolase (beta-lactamase superfamily II)
MIRFAWLFLVLGPAASIAAPLETQPVAEGVWAIVGEKTQRSAGNLGNNATFGLVETAEGIVLIDAGGSWKGAQAIHAEIRKLSGKQVKIVIDTGGQDHRWLGNGYWKAQGARVVSSQAAVDDQKARASQQMSALAQLIGDGLQGTEPSFADETFEADLDFTLGGERFELHHRGQAHTPGDLFVWMPRKRVMFAGDIVFSERILGVGPQSNARSWIKAFDAMAAFAPAQVVPGHGRATTLERARADTRDYLENLRTRIGALIEGGGDILAAPSIDQTAFSRLEQFEELAGRNAQATFEQMEWE